MKLYPILKDRSGNIRPNSYINSLINSTTPGSGKLTVDSFTKSTQGGCRSAVLSASGNYNALWELVDCLRFRVEINDSLMHPVWWGYIHEVEISTGVLSYGVSLDTMYNSVTVSYNAITPGLNDAGSPKTTAATIDTASAGLYGTIEKKLSMSNLSDAQGTAVRDTALSMHKYPVPSIQFSGEMSEGETTARIYCKGWYDTLGWKYYANSGTASVATTTQAGSIIATCGQLLGTISITDASGVSSSIYRDGNTTGLEEMNAILKTGTSAGKQLIAETDISGNMLIYQEPTTDDYIIERTGRITSFMGGIIQPHMVKPGRWAVLRDVIPMNVNTTRITDAARFFIDEVEWSGETVMITPRASREFTDLTRIG